jgi:hypothetical protein
MMKNFMIVSLLTMLTFSVAVTSATAQVSGKLVESRVIWQGDRNITGTDLVRYKDIWFCVYRVGGRVYSRDGELHIISSTDGAKWELAAKIKSPIRGCGLDEPRLVVTPDNRLMLSAMGKRIFVPNSEFVKPGTRSFQKQAMVWFSQDGRDWSAPKPLGERNYVVSSVYWHKGTAFSYGRGCGCGIAQTVQIGYSQTGDDFEEYISELVMDGRKIVWPGSASLVFEGNLGFCLMSGQHGMLGSSKQPYEDWKWQKLDKRILCPDTIRVSDGQIIASVGMCDKKVRTSLCWVDTAAGKLQEILELPTGGLAIKAGLATHDGHLWVSYQQKGKPRSVQLAKVKLETQK